MTLVAIRADASTRIGSGHVMRCLTLADGLKSVGSDVLFISRRYEGNLNSTILSRGHRLCDLPAPSTAFEAAERPTHATRLRVNWEEDAAQTLWALSSEAEKPDWLVVDHYALDGRWAQQLRSAVRKIFVIDDLADRDHECDLLLDQNLHSEFASRYRARVKEGTPLLLGPRYALLAPAYARARSMARVRRGPVARVLIYFGGADQANMTGLALQAFLDLDRHDVKVEVVVTSSHPYRGRLHNMAIGCHNVTLHGDLPTLAPLLAAADIAVGACGTTTWERICLGLPAIVVTLADNQRSIAEALHSKGSIDWVGHYDTVQLTDLRKAIGARLSADIEASFPAFDGSLVDGLGEARVRAALLAGPHTPLYVRRAEAADESLLLDWANDPETRRNAFSQGAIAPGDHHRWFHARLGRLTNCHLLIISTADGVPVGQVRFDREDTKWVVSYSIGPEFRRKGLGRQVLLVGMGAFSSAHDPVVLVARVRPENIRSRKVFESVGYELASETSEQLEFRFAL